MRSDTPAAAPQLLPDLVEALRGDLSRARYTVERTEQLLGEVAVAALHREDPLPARRALAGASDPAAILFSLFTLGAELPAARVAEVLPTLGTGGAQQLGILAPAAGRAAASGAPSLLHATIDLSPYSAQDDHGHIDWWIASDRSELATRAALRPDHVLGVGGASLTLARITPRARVRRVLDLGCGSGIQALHATRHATHVIATDLSERALAFTAFNAALNRAQVEVRQGSLLDPVAGETFDLIVSNPPFVITPRTPGDDADRFTYRDGGRAGDSLLAELLEALPAHLAPGGTAVMLGNWERSGSQEWDQHPRRWLARAQAEGLDCWVIQRESEDPAQYAGTWARDGGITPRDPQWPCLIDGWLDDFESRNVRDIGFGYVLMRRPLPAAPTDAAAAEDRARLPRAPHRPGGRTRRHHAHRAGHRHRQRLPGRAPRSRTAHDAAPARPGRCAARPNPAPTRRGSHRTAPPGARRLGPQPDRAGPGRRSGSHDPSGSGARSNGGGSRRHPHAGADHRCSVRPHGG
ncbi:DUF7059 domain-containing protein [Brachybacterium epidermidis]|uniref:DUF7059 domain-containing protein n=1 Tax=Brachybacterium epidermidis TaxID=2781983 RepID=UPI0032B85477